MRKESTRLRAYPPFFCYYSQFPAHNPILYLMRVLLSACGIGMIVLVLIDAFESILQPRRVTHRFRYSRIYYRNTWAVWSTAAMLFRSGKRREGFLSIFGPLSMLGLFVTWVLGLILGFALIQWSLGLMKTARGAPAGFWT